MSRPCNSCTHLPARILLRALIDVHFPSLHSCKRNGRSFATVASGSLRATSKNGNCPASINPDKAPKLSLLPYYQNGSDIPQGSRGKGSCVTQHRALRSTSGFLGKAGPKKTCMPFGTARASRLSSQSNRFFSTTVAGLYQAYTNGEAAQVFGDHTERRVSVNKFGKTGMSGGNGGKNFKKKKQRSRNATEMHTSKRRIRTESHSKVKSIEKSSGDTHSPMMEKESWRIHKESLKEKFPEGWSPRKKLSPDAMEGIRALHDQNPDQFTTSLLAQYFKVSPEAIRRILKSRWTPTDGEDEERKQRWEKRGIAIWEKMVELGVKPPKKWRDVGVGKAEKGELPRWKDRRTRRGVRMGSSPSFNMGLQERFERDIIMPEPGFGDRIS